MTPVDGEALGRRSLQHFWAFVPAAERIFFDADRPHVYPPPPPRRRNLRLAMLLITLGASALNAGHLAFKQPNPTLATPGAYAETLDQLTHGQQVMELERLCSSLSFHRLAQPDELQLLQQELARMKEEERQRWELQAAVSGGASNELRALEVAEAATEAAVSAVAEAAAAEVAAVAASVAGAEAEAAAAAAEAEAFFAAAKAREAKRTAAEATAAEAAAAAAAEAAAASAALASAKAEVEAEAAGAAECAAAEVAADAASAAEAAAAEAEAAAADVAVAVSEASATAATAAERPISRRASSSPEVAASEATESYVVEREYGRDPRLAPPWITENHQMLRELALLSRAAPAPAYAATSAAVSPVRSLADFEAALERASAGGRMVVLKFYQARCKACLSARAAFEKAAEGPLAEHADFYEVDASVARVLCTLAKVEQLPVAHVYARGELVDTRPLHKPPLIREFVKSLALHAEGYRP